MSDKKQVAPGANINEPVKIVKHSELTRVSEESNFKSICPVCGENGLFMRRDQVAPFYLRNIDNCMWCGQRFEYSDVQDNKFFLLEAK